MLTFLEMRLTAWCAAGLVCGGFGPAQAATPAGALPGPAPVALEAGRWQEHRYSFDFLGFTSTYSCDGLADKLRLLLLTAGARTDAIARSGACASGFGRPDKFARADLVFYTLAPGGDAVPLGSGVAGTWRSVALSSHHPRELRTGDCELVEQFKSNVLPLFATRNLRGNTTCIPYQESGSNIDLRFEVFAASQQLKGRQTPTE